MTIDHFVVEFANTAIPANNPQLVDFDCDLSIHSTSTDEVAARLYVYFARLAVANVIDHGTSIVGISYRAPGSAGGVPLSFPTARVTSFLNIVNAAPWNWATTDVGFGTVLPGSGPLAPLGTSISVSERSATPGPTGRGRHFLPFITSQAVNPGGQVGSGQLADIKQAYGTCFLGLDSTGAGGGPVTVNPLITNAARTTDHPIVSVKPQPVFSNLESRRR
jgi:hypothetical protein